MQARGLEDGSPLTRTEPGPGGGIGIAPKASHHTQDEL